MPATFFGVSEYDRNFRWVDGSLAATCGAPVAGKPSTAMQSVSEPPIQRKSRSVSPMHSSVVLDHPMSSDRRSLQQDDYLLLGRNGKFEQSQPYRNLQKKPDRSQAYQESQKRPEHKKGYQTFQQRSGLLSKAHQQTSQKKPEKSRGYPHNSSNLEKGTIYHDAQKNPDHQSKAYYSLQKKSEQNKAYYNPQKKPNQKQSNWSSQKKPGTVKEAWSSGEAKATKTRPRKITYDPREVDLASDSTFQVTPDAPRNGAAHSCGTQTVANQDSQSRLQPRRRHFTSEYHEAYRPAFCGGPAATSAVVAANRLRNRGTHFSRQHFGQLLGEGTGVWLPTPDTPVAPWRPDENYEEEEEEEEFSEEEDNYEEEEEEGHRGFMPLRVPHEIAGRLPTPRAGPFRRHHLDRTTPAVGGTLLTAPISMRSTDRGSQRGRSWSEQRVAGQPSADDFELLDETDDREKAVRFAPDRTYVVARESARESDRSFASSASSYNYDSDRTVTSSQSSAKYEKSRKVSRAKFR